MRAHGSKWARADEHRKALADKEPRHPGFYRGPYFHPVSHEVHNDRLEYRFYVTKPPVVDTDGASLIAGDCLFNLRSSLDQLVYALHLKRFKGHIPPRIEEQTTFPILDNQRFTKQGVPVPTTRWKEIRHLNLRVRRAIAFLQPYNGRNDKWADTRRALREINDLNRIDKHRRLHLVSVASWSTPVPWFGEPNPYGFRQQSFWVPLEGKTEVFRWTFTSVPPDIAEKLRRHSEVAIGIHLEEWGVRFLLNPTLEAYVNRVAGVLRRFERFAA